MLQSCRLALVAAVVLCALLAASAGAATARPDRSFGAGRGWVKTSLPAVALNAYSAVATRGGKLVVAGQSSTSKGVTQIVVAR